ncbi:hypothetical protein JL193_01245 [Polaribacter batillariae]|uniref:DUF1735 domain-containing protein n=1 Tax=Polaribacter batillariae TaxID=2808900 RepID=A0ABX7SUN8_9FLAO|nr:DUF6452 family protein [Polaribacter batillariae]QTD37959.1 hypothetical protein JL193_01245 [Polaribacter batillariae]
MKKTFLFLLLIFAFISACEKDDFCLQNPVTPRLVITFFDDTNRETPKRVQRFSLIAESRVDSLFTGISTFDSIAIPLNPNALETKYTLKKNTVNGAKVDNEFATFTITYETEQEYVSRSCGYRVIFKNVTFSTEPNTWITDFTPTTLTTIDNQNSAHVQIFH